MWRKFLAEVIFVVVLCFDKHSLWLSSVVLQNKAIFASFSYMLESRSTSNSGKDNSYTIADVGTYYIFISWTVVDLFLSKSIFSSCSVTPVLSQWCYTFKYLTSECHSGIAPDCWLSANDNVNRFCFQWLFQWCYFWPLPYCSNWSHGAVEIQDTEKKGKQENTLNFQNRPKRGRAEMREKHCELSKWTQERKGRIEKQCELSKWTPSQVSQACSMVQFLDQRSSWWFSAPQ